MTGTGTAARLKLAELVAADLMALRERAVEVADIASAADFHASTPLHAGLAFRAEQFYTACETALVRVLRAVDGGVTESGSWHLQVLEDAAVSVPDVRPAILSREAAEVLAGLLGFRHFLRHAYAVALDPERLTARARDVERAAGLVGRDLACFLGWLRK